MTNYKEPLVRLSGNRLITTLLAISHHFNRKHGHVLRDIQNLECSPDFRESNFGLSSYTTSQGKQLPMYEITRDGFSPPCLRRLFVHNEGRGVENLVTSGLPHPTLWFFYARTGDPAMPGGQRIQYPQGESSRLTSYSFRTPRHPINRDSSKKLTRSQS